MTRTHGGLFQLELHKFLITVQYVDTSRIKTRNKNIFVIAVNTYVSYLTHWL